MSTEFEVEIVYITETPSTRPGRVGKTDMLVVYRLPEGFTRIVTIPKEEFSEETLQKAIAEDLKELAKWRGKRLKVSVPAGT